MQRNPIGLAHKYWGKKPYFLSKYVISNYTKKGDIVLDPFCGSGSLVIDAVFNNRKLIGIDINPASILFNKIVTNGAPYEEILDAWNNNLKPKLKELDYEIYGKNENNIKTFLRSKDNDKILAIKLANGNEIEGDHFFQFEEKDNFMHEGFKKQLIRNGRLSIKENTKIKDFFTDVSLYSHNQILKLIGGLSESLKEFFLVAFTANIANCSKLLPPIKTRGRFAPGAWMTGFYVANEYLDNNVFHYYTNRVGKLLSAKKYFESKYAKNEFGTILDVLKNNASYNFSLGNVMNLDIPDGSIDIIITDPPYEGAVPYLEQSILWNVFLPLNIDYENEIIVSDAKYRGKNKERFNKELGKSFQELNRVLKNKGKLILTYNSIDENSLISLNNELLKGGFSISEVMNVTQKTATPRQINRKNTVKGDLLIICDKVIDKVIDKNTVRFDFGIGLLDRINQINFLNYNQQSLGLFNK